MRLQYITLAALLATACTQAPEKPTRDGLASDIAALEQAFKPGTSTNANKEKAQAEELVLRYTQFVQTYPEDAMVPELLLKSARVSVGLKEYEAAIRYLDRVIADFSTYDQVVECHLFKGFIYEVHLNSYAEAVAAYQGLIDRFPNHRLAADARAAIENLQLTDEELLEKFRQVNTPAS